MSRFFIDRPIVAIVIAILTVIGGLVMLQRLPIAQYPDIVPPIIQIKTTYTGADALAVEKSVATPIEQQVNGVQGMIYMKSINGSDGTMTLQVSLRRRHRREPRPGLRAEPALAGDLAAADVGRRVRHHGAADRRPAAAGDPDLLARRQLTTPTSSATTPRST